MKLQEIMSKDVKHVEPDMRVREAAIIMREAGIGMLPVLDLEHIPVGVITDRDITIRALARGLPPNAHIREIMTVDIHCLRLDCDLDQALNLMESAMISRVLVCDNVGRLVGVVSIGDAALACHGEEHTDRVVATLAKRNMRGARDIASSII